LAEAGAAVHLPEDELSPDRLWSELAGLAGDEARRREMAARGLERARPGAAQEIARKLLELAERE
jgi:UDP-N-acetylglucosamine--N-acetylmuramyl-(pentapeptide) pyrophosphoryl-undecaprenol N-acetylglucosamine transferase